MVTANSVCFALSRTSFAVVENELSPRSATEKSDKLQDRQFGSGTICCSLRGWLPMQHELALTPSGEFDVSIGFALLPPADVPRGRPGPVGAGVPRAALTRLKKADSTSLAAASFSLHPKALPCVL